jgi:hypothetical protein
MRHLSICLAAAMLLAPAAAVAQKPDAAEMEKCAADWEAIQDGLKRNRQQAERRRLGAVGDPSKAEKKEQAALDDGLARFLPACGKYGFESPGNDPRAEIRNNSIAKDLRKKTGTKPGDPRKP